MTNKDFRRIGENGAKTNKKVHNGKLGIDRIEIRGCTYFLKRK